jgi:hypothetical protein
MDESSNDLIAARIYLKRAVVCDGHSQNSYGELIQISYDIGMNRVTPLVRSFIERWDKRYKIEMKQEE